jgi:two-component system, chemotaxis family, CheB/CheR fusion protein
MPDSPARKAKITQPSNRRVTPARGPSSNSDGFSIVGIGASAGGLDACRSFLDALPADCGMAFILVQHLDPTHESMMVDLLAGHTSMTVLQATDGMPIKRNHLYVIPPGTYLSVGHGALHLSQPHARHGARLPFDFLLNSLALDCGSRAIAVILSGTGADGSVGLKAVGENGGLVIAQDPDEAGHDGMPRNAISTGLVDQVLPVGKMRGALGNYRPQLVVKGPKTGLDSQDDAHDRLPEIINLLLTKTAHNFTLYKQGTLRRRIERRMGLATIEVHDMNRYLKLLHSDPREFDLLAKDFLINVTSFFRDPKVFDFLAEKIIPDLINCQAPDHILRIWIAGCSTGEETYSLVMLFREAITSAKRNVKLQVFASDVDPDAVAVARDGLYPQSIEADVSPVRLARFFIKEERGYRILPDLRAAIVFTVQDVLADPPFSRLDLVSCRNLLIYLGPEAQAKTISAFHFALRDGGVLLLGNSETVGNFDRQFEVISKSERLFRHVGHARPGDFSFSIGGGARPPSMTSQGLKPSRQTALADLCKRLVIESFAPAAVLINRKYECLYSLGPTDRYLRVAPGHPTQDLLAMARANIRTKLRSAVQRADQDKARIVVPGGEIAHNGSAQPFNIAVQPVLFDGNDLFLICFIDAPKQHKRSDGLASSEDTSRVAELQQELEATRTELQAAIRNLEISSEEQKAINEDALSDNEEFQSTNEELRTSKEELQSLNEELTALNSQLQETLERQRTTSNDLQNVLYSTDVATLFLDTQLKIRFFTPATKSLFNVIPSDVGRSISDLHSLVADDALETDARTVLSTLVPIDQEIETQAGACYLRRILPYRTRNKGIEGVVITFADITERKHISDALAAAKRQAELANVAKSRFLAAASHDLRQPLQSLSLVRGLLERKVRENKTEEALKLIRRLDETGDTMSGMLNTLLDINQIDSGTVSVNRANFRIDDLLDRLKVEFSYHAQAHNLAFRVIACSLSVNSDVRLLEQMLRNLLTNALKYTKHGKVLLGCRRHAGMLTIEVCDTGPGIPEGEFQAIFEEYHQLDNAAGERSRGLGLGLSIVNGLGKLLDHRVGVRSQTGKGSIFAVDVPLSSSEPGAAPKHAELTFKDKRISDAMRKCMILIVDDDPDVRELLELYLNGEGHRTTTAPHGMAALSLATRWTIRPDLILVDYNLPNGMDGLQVAAKLRDALHREVPVIILTGDVSTDTLGNIAHYDCVQLSKPVKLTELTRAIQRLLPKAQSAAEAHPTNSFETETPEASVVFVVDDDQEVCEAMRAVLEDDGYPVETYSSSESFLEAYRPGRKGCLLLDAYLPRMSGVDLLRRLHDRGDRLPTIMITGSSDVPIAVEAMKAGAIDFIEKPISCSELLSSLNSALEQSRNSSKLFASRETAAATIASLTPRQHQIMDMVLAGHPSKNIAADLGISQRTVENHRASIMEKTGSKSLPALARLALAAHWNDPKELPNYVSSRR